MRGPAVCLHDGMAAVASMLMTTSFIGSVTKGKEEYSLGGCFRQKKKSLFRANQSTI